VVLAAAVTAGNAGGCGSNSLSSEDADDTSQRDASTADASLPDTSLPDTASDLAAAEVVALDGGAGDSTRLDGVADTLGADVFLRMDASVTPEVPGPLTMPAGTLYDVLTREHLS
jgi:hypothetical protein